MLGLPLLTHAWPAGSTAWYGRPTCGPTWPAGSTARANLHLLSTPPQKKLLFLGAGNKSNCFKLPCSLLEVDSSAVEAWVSNGSLDIACRYEFKVCVECPEYKYIIYSNAHVSYVQNAKNVTTII